MKPSEIDNNPGSSQPELIVVGAGVIGGAVALGLARAGRRFRWIAPFHNPTSSATSAAGAMLGVLGELEHEPRTRQDDSDLELRRLASDRYPAWLEQIASAGGFPPALKLGTFVVAGTRRDSDRIALDAMETLATRLGRSSERVDASDVPGLRPASGMEPERVISLASEGFINADALLKELVRAAKASASLVDDSVTRLIVRTDRVAGVETQRHGSFEADEVILCAGAGTQELVESLIPTISACVPAIIQSKGASLLLERPHRNTSAYHHVLRTPNREFACGLHVVPRNGTTVYVGATNRVSRLPGATGELTASDTLYLLDGVTKEFSIDLEHWNIAAGTFGYRPLSVDGWPIAGRTNVPGLSIGSGTYRNGVLLAPVVADAIVTEIDQGRPDPANRLSPLHPDRPAPTPNVLQAGLRDMALLFDDPGASWWRGRLDEILAALGTLAGTDEQAHDLRVSVAALLERYPRPEMVPEALVELLQAVRED
jgi:glycine/D-amino acid oxidase-like deaminating enzyme